MKKEEMMTFENVLSCLSYSKLIIHGSVNGIHFDEPQYLDTFLEEGNYFMDDDDYEASPLPNAKVSKVWLEGNGCFGSNEIHIELADGQ